ncbi:hypothetical protein BJ875DRAFT_435140 [Amylocarpus encephaloides]|uniref:Lysine 2,3-aminomutase n=1 Tax=Amylocarpus encephaloides TaxID=45428 RepID=A0A9P7Y8T4_9HELO|nr:hypothetical protein BJ875DRAFT_435140 [Amylocarpus encephaloides]
MRVNNYVLNNHINWTKDLANDPYFRLVFPQPDMLQEPEHVESLINLAKSKVSAAGKAVHVEKLREKLDLNAHPAGQLTENVPMMDGKPVEGVQHKYQATMLIFPSEGQYCHSYCTYCFRWQQFTNVGSQQQFKSDQANDFLNYIKSHKHIKDLLFTGGDPMTMSAEVLGNYLDPILKDPECSHVQTVRIGTKSLAYWPRRFTTDADAKPMLDLFRRVDKSGRNLSIQAHFSHPVELDTPEVAEAIKNIKKTGAVIRTQAPLIKGINDSAATWAEMWNKQTRMGLIPYYMFVERDTGARKFFEVPLARALEIHHEAISECPGTARTLRGPSMSAGPGKIQVLGISSFLGEKVFVLKFLQARNPHWCAPDKLFYAKFDPGAVWLDDLTPAFGEKRWFFEDEYDEMKTRTDGSSGQRLFTS